MAIALLGAFFLPYWKENSINYSGFDIVLHGTLTRRFILLAIPLSGLVLLAGAFEKGSYSKGLFHWLPIITIVAIGFIVSSLELNPNLDRSDAGIFAWFSKTMKGSSYGLWITAAVSIILLFGDWIATKPNK